MKITKFLQICLGISLVTLSMTAFLHTITPAQAEEKTLVNTGEELTIENAKTNTTGKIMMSESAMEFKGSAMYHILVWNSETGKNKLYVYNKGDMVKATYQLPSNPLP